MINIQARTITDELASLVKQIDALVDDASKPRKGSHAFVVLLADDPDTAAPQLEALAKKHNIKNTPLTIFDGVSGPKGFKVAKDAEVTVMLWKGLKVAANYAFGKGELDAAAVERIVADAKKHVKSVKKRKKKVAKTK